MLKSYPFGTTVRLNCTFKDFNNENIDPQIVRVIIYNYKYDLLETLTATKKAIGEYFLDYKTPNKSQTFYYEWYGEIDGMPSIIRSGFITKFM
jgi:hypothetical protein